MEKICSDCAMKPKMNCFNCEMERDCKVCLYLFSKKKTNSTDINMVKRNPANEYYQMLPFYEGENKPKQNIIDFESAKEVLTEEAYKMVVRRRFERIYNIMECKSYIKNEDIPGKKEIFIYRFKHVETDKIEYFILIGCESDELYENDKLLNFWAKNFVNKEKEKRFQNNRMVFYNLR